MKRKISFDARKTLFSAFFFQHKHGQIAEQRATSRSLITYAYDVTWLTRRARGIHISSQITVMAMRGGGGKTCAADAPGKVSCTNNSYSPAISMHIFPQMRKLGLSGSSLCGLTGQIGSPSNTVICAHCPLTRAVSPA